MWWIRVKGDCSLLIRNVTVHDQGEYTCLFANHNVENVPSLAQGIERFVIHKVMLTIRNLKLEDISKERNPAGFATADPEMSHIVDNKNQVILETEAETLDSEEESNDWLTDQVRALQKRESTWKAFGFDAGTLQISDPVAGRILWFQQLTHSVRSVKKIDGPCVVKVPSPGTRQAILEPMSEPLAPICQFYALSWLFYQQQAARDALMALSVNLYKPKRECAWLLKLPYLNLFGESEDITSAVTEAMTVVSTKATTCFCSNDTYNGPRMFMGISTCENYVMRFAKSSHRAVDDLYEVTFNAPDKANSRTLTVKNQTLKLPIVTLTGKDLWWVCGNKAYIFLPYGWTGCCYLATLKLPYEVYTIHKGQESSDKEQLNTTSGHRVKREMAQFHEIEAYHFRVSLAEKWGIGLFPCNGVTFLADHIDNITYTLQGFADQTCSL